MTVFLRHVQTGHYYRGNYEWVVQQEDARDFGSIERALEVVAGDKLDGMSLVIRYEENGRVQVFDLRKGVPAAKPPEKAKPE